LAARSSSSLKKVLKEVAKFSTHEFYYPDNFFKKDILLHVPGYQFKPVKGSSKVLDINKCPRYYYASHMSIYISPISNWYTPDSVSLLC